MCGFYVNKFICIIYSFGKESLKILDAYGTPIQLRVCVFENQEILKQPKLYLL